MEFVRLGGSQNVPVICMMLAFMSHSVAALALTPSRRAGSTQSFGSPPRVHTTALFPPTCVFIRSFCERSPRMPSRLRASERLRSCFLWLKNMALLRVGGGEVEARIRALSGDVKAILQGFYRALADYFGAFLLNIFSTLAMRLSR